MRFGKLDLFTKREMIYGVRELHVGELKVVYVKLADGEALSGCKVEAAGHLQDAEIDELKVSHKCG